MPVSELIENLVWSATFVQRNRLRVMHDAHQAARRKLAWRYRNETGQRGSGPTFAEMERMAPLRAIGRDLNVLMKNARERDVFELLMRRQDGWAPGIFTAPSMRAKRS